MILSGCANSGWELGGFVEIDVAVEEKIFRTTKEVEEAPSLGTWPRHGGLSEIKVV